MVVIENGKSSSENLKKISWVDEQTEEALNKLGGDTEKKFYEEDSEKKVVTYKMEVVKQYLTSLYEKVKDITNTREAWNKLVEEGNTSAWIMAVQIALESLGNSTYDVGKIDGILGKETKNAVENFQKDNGLIPDGAPGKDTIKILLEKMGGAVEQQEDPFKDVKVKEEIDVPEEREVEAGDLVEGLPEGATVEFEEGSSVDKTKDGEEQEVTVIVKKGEKTKKITIIVKVDVENKKITAKEKKEDKEDEEIPEKSRLDALTIDDLGSWDLDGNFVFEAGLINEETNELTVKDKTIPMIEDGGEGFGYMVKDRMVRIGNIKNGVLDGYGVEFYPYGDDFQETGEYNAYGLKLQGEWKEGELKDGLEIVRENGLIIDIEIKEGKPTKASLEDESISVDFENREDGLYLKNKNSTLKLKNKYSSVAIIKILNDYKDKEGSFSTDLSEGYKSKKIIWTPADGDEKEVKEVYRYADNLISDEMFESEGLRLSGWLNEYRETHQEFKLENYGEFDSEGKFVFKDGVEHTDENGKKYIEYNKEKYYGYEDGMNGLGYQVNSSEDRWSFYIGNFVDGKCEGKGIIIHSDGVRYDGEWKNDMSEGRGLTTWSNGNKFEGEYKEDEREKGKFTLVDPEEIAGEYEVERDDKGLRIVSGEHEGKYINDEEWKIEEKVEDGFKLEEYGEFDSEGKFVFKEGVEQTDENGKKYVEYKGEKYYEYEDEINGLGYNTGTRTENDENFGWIYLGNYVDGKQDGRGILIHSTGNKYEGEFKNDVREGQGIITWANGNKFGGESKENKMEKGKFTLVTPEEIAGEYGVERDEKGLKIVSGEHEGEYINYEEWKIEEKVEENEFKLEEYGEFDSEGKFIFKDGVEKTDENGKKYIEYNEEKYYEYEDEINGLGYKVGADYLYIGNFVDGKLEGKGTMIWADGDKVEGEWKNNQMEGEGTTTWANGNKFVGERKENKIEKGKFTIVTPEEIAGEYEVERDEKGLRIVSEGENNGKYLDAVNWTIEDKAEDEDETGKEAWVEAFNFNEIGLFEKTKLNSYSEYLFNYSFKEGVVKTDENGKKYIEVGGKKFYENNENGLCYVMGDHYFWIGRRENGYQVGHWIEYGEFGEKREGDYNSEGKKEGEWTITAASGTTTTKTYKDGEEVSE